MDRFSDRLFAPLDRLFVYVMTLLAILVMLLAPEMSIAAAGVSAQVNASAFGTYTGTNGAGDVQFNFNVQDAYPIAAGTAAGKADLMFADRRTIAASGTDVLDLAGTLADPFGVVLTFLHVKVIYVEADCGNTNNVVISPGATNPFNGPFAGTTPSIAIPPCSVALLTHEGAGWAVTASTGDLFKVANSGSGTSVIYKVLIIGAST